MNVVNRRPEPPGGPPKSGSFGPPGRRPPPTPLKGNNLRASQPADNKSIPRDVQQRQSEPILPERRPRTHTEVARTPRSAAILQQAPKHPRFEINNSAPSSSNNSAPSSGNNSPVQNPPQKNLRFGATSVQLPPRNKPRAETTTNNNHINPPPKMTQSNPTVPLPPRNNRSETVSLAKKNFTPTQNSPKITHFETTTPSLPPRLDPSLPLALPPRKSTRFNEPPKLVPQNQDDQPQDTYKSHNTEQIKFNIQLNVNLNIQVEPPPEPPNGNQDSTQGLVYQDENDWEDLEKAILAGTCTNETEEEISIDDKHKRRRDFFYEDNNEPIMQNKNAFDFSMDKVSKLEVSLWEKEFRQRDNSLDGEGRKGPGNPSVSVRNAREAWNKIGDSKTADDLPKVDKTANDIKSGNISEKKNNLLQRNYSTTGIADKSRIRSTTLKDDDRIKMLESTFQRPTPPATQPSQNTPTSTNATQIIPSTPAHVGPGLPNRALRASVHFGSVNIRHGGEDRKMIASRPPPLPERNPSGSDPALKYSATHDKPLPIPERKKVEDDKKVDGTEPKKVDGTEPKKVDGTEPKKEEKLTKKQLAKKKREEKRRQREEKKKLKEDQKTQKQSKKKEKKGEKKVEKKVEKKGEKKGKKRGKEKGSKTTKESRSGTTVLAPSSNPSVKFGGSAITPTPRTSSTSAAPSPSASFGGEKTRFVNEEDLDSRVYLFEEPDSEENILFSEEKKETPQIHGATIYKLVQRLTFDKYPDPKYVNAFLLTYRSFAQPKELLEWLILRFDTPEMEGVDKETFLNSKQIVIRLRVFNVLKQWIDKHFHDFKEDPELIKQLQTFIEEIMIPEGMKKSADHLKSILKKKQREGSKSKNKALQFSKPPPKPHLPMNVTSRLQLRDINPEEVARQLTLIEEKLYKSIEPTECLNLRWTKADKEVGSPNIIALIKRFNDVSRWVSSSIVEVTEVKHRAAILHRFIYIAWQSFTLNNFNCVMEIVSGMQNSAIFRLKATWRLLPQESWEMWERMNDVMSSADNFRLIREKLHSIDPPCVPYLGIFLTDLTFIQQGNADHIQQTKLVNFTKLRYVARVIGEIQQYQQTPYCLEPVEFLQSYLVHEGPMYSDQELYELSLKCEPKVPKK